MSTENTESKNLQKYCCDPFKNHKRKNQKDIRFVSAYLVLKYPSKIQIGQKICTSCRKRLKKQPPENSVPDEFFIELDRWDAIPALWENTYHPKLNEAA